MTLEEAVATYHRRFATKGEIDAAYGVMLDHAKRTLAALGDEPKGVQLSRQIAGGAFDITDEGRALYRQIVEHIDTLHARLNAVTRERDALRETVDEMKLSVVQVAATIAAVANLLRNQLNAEGRDALDRLTRQLESTGAA